MQKLTIPGVWFTPVGAKSDGDVTTEGVGGQVGSEGSPPSGVTAPDAAVGVEYENVGEGLAGGVNGFVKDGDDVGVGVTDEGVAVGAGDRVAGDRVGAGLVGVGVGVVVAIEGEDALADVPLTHGYGVCVLAEAT